MSFHVSPQVAEEDENVFGVDPLEIQRSEARSDKEELRCVIAVIRHGGKYRNMLFSICKEKVARNRNRAIIACPCAPHTHSPKTVPASGVE